MKDDAKKEEPEVTPFAGVWIEMQSLYHYRISDNVTPFAGVWIEICCLFRSARCRIVTPFAGVWIEIQNMKLEHRQKISLSS